MNRFLSLPLMMVTLLAPVPVIAHEGNHDHPDVPRPPQQVSQPAASPSSGGLYRWADDSGQVHYSQGLDSVPEQFRSKAVPLGRPTPAPPSATK